MRQTRLNRHSGRLGRTAAITLLFSLMFAAGCGPKATSRAEEEKKFLAPTDISKLRPEAQEALRHMPGGDKASQSRNTPAPK